MEFSLSAPFASRLVFLEEASSTNDSLAAFARQAPFGEWPEYSVVVTDNQTAGRGRLGRQWAAPRGTMLAVSVLLRPARAGVQDTGSLSWLPLLAGLAMSRALSGFGVHAELKWPNDVLIGGRKVCGILAEAHPDDVVIIGSGVNISMTDAQLPVATATSMRIEGANVAPDAVLAAYLAALREFYERFADAHGDAEASGIRESVQAACSTIGRIVRVQLPGARDLVGLAEGLDESGRLVVVADARRTAVSAGGVTHLRY